MPHLVWIKKLLLPPAGPLLTALGCFALLWLGPEGARILAFVGLGLALATLYLLSLPFLAFALLRRLESHPPLDLRPSADRSTWALPAESGSTALVVLDAGRYSRRIEGHGDLGILKPETLERLAHAAAVQRAAQTHGLSLPILVTGNGAGAAMATVLRDSFGLEVAWIEAQSRNTQENAWHSAKLLGARGVDDTGGFEKPEGPFRQVVLVTHSWHMTRAVRAFERAGLAVTPAPMGFAGPDRWQLRALSFVPSVSALVASHLAFHELVGSIWYALRYSSAAADVPKPRP